MTSARSPTIRCALGAVCSTCRPPTSRALEKAKSIPADAIIFDLEDAVAPDAKAEARAQAVAAAASGDYGNRELTIRCNGLDTPWGADDLAAAATSGAAAVVIPKVDSVDYLDQISDRLDRRRRARRTWPSGPWSRPRPPSSTPGPSPPRARVAVLVMGTNDLAKELRAAQQPGRATLLPHLATALCWPPARRAR